jgi:hypothetical protein
MARRGLGGRGRRQGGFGLRNVEGFRRHGSRHFIRSRLRLASRLGEPDWPEGQDRLEIDGRPAEPACAPRRRQRSSTTSRSLVGSNLRCPE